MKSKFIWNATTKEAELVLNGDYDDAELSEISRMFFNSITRMTELDSLTPDITVADLRGKFSKWRELTSTSPSGRHLGHYKLLFQTIDRSLTADERTKYMAMQEEIAECYVALLNYAIRHNYSLERWRQIVNMMIYKEEGNVKIHKLQVLHLYEMDLNFMLGLKWKDAIH